MKWSNRSDWKYIAPAQIIFIGSMFIDVIVIIIIVLIFYHRRRAHSSSSFHRDYKAFSINTNRCHPYHVSPWLWTSTSAGIQCLTRFRVKGAGAPTPSPCSEAALHLLLSIYRLLCRVLVSSFTVYSSYILIQYRWLSSTQKQWDGSCVVSIIYSGFSFILVWGKNT